MIDYFTRQIIECRRREKEKWEKRLPIDINKLNIHQEKNILFVSNDESIDETKIMKYSRDCTRDRHIGGATLYKTEELIEFIESIKGDAVEVHFLIHEKGIQGRLDRREVTSRNLKRVYEAIPYFQWVSAIDGSVADLKSAYLFEIDEIDKEIRALELEKQKYVNKMLTLQDA